MALIQISKSKMCDDTHPIGFFAHTRDALLHSFLVSLDTQINTKSASFITSLPMYKVRTHQIINCKFVTKILSDSLTVPGVYFHPLSFSSEMFVFCLSLSFSQTINKGSVNFRIKEEHANQPTHS